MKIKLSKIRRMINEELEHHKTGTVLSSRGEESCVMCNDIGDVKDFENCMHCDGGPYCKECIYKHALKRHPNSMLGNLAKMRLKNDDLRESRRFI